MIATAKRINEKKSTKLTPRQTEVVPEENRREPQVDQQRRVKQLITAVEEDPDADVKKDQRPRPQVKHPILQRPTIHAGITPHTLPGVAQRCSRGGGFGCSLPGVSLLEPWFLESV
jgi:hypothetical protein